jgi:hypothetical protein
MSPGVEVQVIDESFYVSPEPSTRPLIILATAQDKVNASGTGIARGTLAANANKIQLVASQRELVDLFGTPIFYKDPSQNPIHGGELNEYGLQAAYSFLGIANSAYVIRADIDLKELIAQYDPPGSDPAAGTYWLDTQNTRVGIFQWNGSPSTVSGGQKFTNRVPLIITDATKLDELSGAPKGSIGVAGDYALVSVSNLNKLYYKNRATDLSVSTWVEVGTNEWHASWPAITSGKTNPTAIANTSSMVINGTEVFSSGTTVATLAADINLAGIRGITAAVVDGKLEIYSNGAVDSPQMDSTTSNAIVIAEGFTDTGDTPLVAATASASALGIAVGTYYGPALQISPHTSVPRWKAGLIDGATIDVAPRPTGSVWIKTTDVNLGARWRVKLWNTTTRDWDPINAPVYSNNEEALYRLDRAQGGRNIPTGALYVQYNFNEDSGTDSTPRVANFKIMRRVRPDPTSITSGIITASTFASGTYTLQIAETLATVATLQAFQTITLPLTGAMDDADVISEAINNAPFINIEASVDSKNRLIITHKLGGDFRLRDGTGTPMAFMGFYPYDLSANSGTPNLYRDPFDPDPDFGDTTWYIASNWKPLSYTASEDPPQSLPADGRLWYKSTLDEVDIMVHNGRTWVGYLYEGAGSGPVDYLDPSPYYQANEEFQTDPNGPIVQATKPTLQSDGTSLRHGDLWIDSGDIENYPALYKYDGFNLVWVPVDTTDQTTEDGIIFADARFNTSGANSDSQGTIQDLLTSNFIDFDAPDPDLYPRGMLLFNTRRSGFNVKRFVRNYIDNDLDNERFNNGESMDGYYPHRWVNESGNAANGAGLFGRKAQRKVVVKRLKAITNSNQEIRDFERYTFNLIATPGYVENLSNMNTLNSDRKLTAFVIGDSPFRLANDSTTLQNWATNASLAVDNGDEGLVTYDPYCAVYYPSGYTSDNLGNDIVVPPSHMVLRTIALSDNVSHPWFAPAGIRRGGVTNATSIGYVDAREGEFRSIALNEGQRDVLYAAKVNPITFLTAQGLVIFGQKTRARADSALDRVNVARLVIYLRGQLDKLCKPYIFEPNDKITRDEVKSAADSLMLGLVGQRAIYDFLTVCDETNNTPSRIDRNELWLDIAIEPVKAIEFIYIPLRLKNTGEIQGLV